MSTHLDRIMARHRAEAEADGRDRDHLLELAAQVPAPRDFAGALRSEGLSVIAEIKRRSPSAGDLNLDLDPARLASQYEDGGARCLSVLTDQPDFGGSAEDLQAARQAVSLPVLRKDFVVDVRDIADARLMGADAVLLIVGALEQKELQTLFDTATNLGLTALVEVHAEEEVKRAVDIGARVIGVNQRDLQTFAVNSTHAERMRDMLPPDAIAVAESAIATARDTHALASHGYDAVLVGTALVTAPSPQELLKEMTGAPCS